MLGLDSGLLNGSLDLCGEGGRRLLRRYARPQGTAAPLLKLADAADPEREDRRADLLQRDRNVVGYRTFDFSNKP